MSNPFKLRSCDGCGGEGHHLIKLEVVIRVKDEAFPASIHVCPNCFGIRHRIALAIDAAERVVRQFHDAVLR